VTKKKSKPRKKGIFWTLVFTVLTAVSGGGIGGYLNPNLPVLGPLIRNILSSDKLDFILDSTGESVGFPAGNPFPGSNAAFQGNVPVQLPTAQRPADKIYIATFNIQVFGKSKMEKADVMSVIVQVIRQFDIVAIQEIRAKDDDILPGLMQMLNADGSRYDFLIGPRLGRSVSTEQYAYIFDTNRIEYDPNSVGTIGDPADLLHREPFVARFRPRTQFPEQAFTFWLVDTHTDPDDVPREVAALAQVFQLMQRARPDEDDVILLGDLNANEFEMGPIAGIPGISWVVGGGVTTNTRQDKAYDNIIFQRPSTSEFTGRWGVLNLQSVFRLTEDDALKVSDHYPVWAEFGIWEGLPGGQVADRPLESRR
jgi:hypothetical protein